RADAWSAAAQRAHQAFGLVADDRSGLWDGAFLRRTRGSRNHGAQPRSRQHLWSAVGGHLRVHDYRPALGRTRPNGGLIRGHGHRADGEPAGVRGNIAGGTAGSRLAMAGRPGYRMAGRVPDRSGLFVPDPRNSTGARIRGHNSAAAGAGAEPRLDLAGAWGASGGAGIRGRGGYSFLDAGELVVAGPAAAMRRLGPLFAA